MPVRRAAWSAWNFLADEHGASGADEDRVTLTYWMNLLQSLPEAEHGPVLVTLNPPAGDAHPRAALTVREQAYEHPVYTAASVGSQRVVRALSGRDALYFAGAWLKYGFHEDGCSAGLRAAIALGAQPPFALRPAERPVPALPVATAAIAVAERARRTLAALVCVPALLLLLATLAVLRRTARVTFALLGSAQDAHAHAHAQARAARVYRLLDTLDAHAHRSLGADRPNSRIWSPKAAQHAQ